jgi:hypothetical protein
MLRSGESRQGTRWNLFFAPVFLSGSEQTKRRKVMGRYLLLWILGIPLPILLLIALLGGLR